MNFTHHAPKEALLEQQHGEQEAGRIENRDHPSKDISNLSIKEEIEVEIPSAYNNMNVPDESATSNTTGRVQFNSNGNLRKSKVTNVVQTVHQSIRRTSTNIDGGGFTDTSFQNYSSSRKAIVKAMVIILIYLITGTVVFGFWMEDWNAIDAAYFTVATFTTVGYGDLYPISMGQRLFGILFVLTGIMVIGGVVLGILMDSLLHMFTESSSDKKKDAQKKFFGNFSDKGDLGNSAPPQAQDTPADPSAATSKLKEFLQGVFKNLVLAALIFVPGIVIGHFEGWKFYDSLYYCVVTATTVGYGDLSPQNMWTRLAACFYLPLCVTVMANVFGQITSLYMDKKTQEATNEFFHRKLTVKDLEQMDFGGDGEVNSEEFMVFMLVTLGKVDQEDIEEIQALFHKLDRDNGGCLDMEDICLMAFGDDEARNGSRSASPQSRRSTDKNV